MRASGRRSARGQLRPSPFTPEKCRLLVRCRSMAKVRYRSLSRHGRPAQSERHPSAAAKVRQRRPSADSGRSQDPDRAARARQKQVSISGLRRHCAREHAIRGAADQLGYRPVEPAGDDPANDRHEFAESRDIARARHAGHRNPGGVLDLFEQARAICSRPRHGSGGCRSGPRHPLSYRPLWSRSGRPTPAHGLRRRGYRGRADARSRQSGAPG